MPAASKEAAPPWIGPLRSHTARSQLASTRVDSVWVNHRLEECRAGRQRLILDRRFSSAFVRGAKGAGGVRS